MNWEKIKPVHFYKDPVEHFYTSSIFDMLKYDRLYENQKNLEHRVWQEFDEQYKTGFEFFEDLRQLDKKKEIICLWLLTITFTSSSPHSLISTAKTVSCFELITCFNSNDGYKTSPFISNISEEVSKSLHKYAE